MQVEPAWGNEHCFPHCPQCNGSSTTCASQPFAKSPSQSAQSFSQLSIVQTPAAHEVVACCSVQAQPQRPAIPPPPQVSPCPHPPQSICLPQPSLIVPHEIPSCAQVLAAQPHWFATPVPPHTAGGVQVPQSTALLHPSDT